MRSLAYLILLLSLSSSLSEQLGLVKSSSGGGKSSSSECDSTRVFYWVKDLQKHSSEIGGRDGKSTIGFAVDELPIYYIGKKKAGFLTEANIVTGDDCSYTGVFSFDPSKNGLSKDQVFYQG